MELWLTILATDLLHDWFRSLVVLTLKRESLFVNNMAPTIKILQERRNLGCLIFSDPLAVFPNLTPSLLVTRYSISPRLKIPRNGQCKGSLCVVSPAQALTKPKCLTDYKLIDLASVTELGNDSFPSSRGWHQEGEDSQGKGG